MVLTPADTARLHDRLQRLYGHQAGACLQKLHELIGKYEPRLAGQESHDWDRQDVVLITYADQIQDEGEAPLRTLLRFLLQHRLDTRLSTVHLLPFFPSSSDDGFSVIDYQQVDPAVGDWEDVETLDKSFWLMFDLVLNHCSQQSAWFQNYLAGREPGLRYFIEVDPSLDLSMVVRPRSLPLLTPFETSRGTRHLWTTFSADQIDLNFAEPDLLLAMLDVFLSYIERGAQIVRLDAIAYLWKEIGTTCIHLPQTHEVVKLMRDLVDLLAPGVLLLTETNVPHRENVSYFGEGDETHLVYQFSLGPLLLDAFLTGDATPLKRWLAQLAPPREGTTYFNFTASHDGIGVRPLEGLVEPQRLAKLLQAVERRGGRISYKRNADGSQSPYELNITWFSALQPEGEYVGQQHVDAFLASQAVMLALQGIPGIYFHSLVGTPNDQAAVDHSGHARRINRRKFSWQELEHAIGDESSVQGRIFAGYKRLLDLRRVQRAFHPGGAQQVFNLDDPALVALLRASPDKSEHLLVLANISSTAREVDLQQFAPWTFSADLLNPDFRPDEAAPLKLEPYQVAWLRAESR